MGKATRDALKQAIPDYTWVQMVGDHFTACGPNAVSKIVRWLKEKTPVGGSTRVAAQNV